ncbi:sensor histidine kinase [Ornithinimicrobium avium]|uniref:hypothetical protein n=1 Tax=Ornithinimicrobium avium TaxID=2283195 RepID=UPI0013B3762D|nr:hypothetical protein [Ornithinimicrobium avium]
MLIVVENNGRARASQVQGSGTGLGGLQERVGLLGGVVQYGPRGDEAGGDVDEGWRVEARIPWAMR